MYSLALASISTEALVVNKLTNEAAQWRNSVMDIGGEVLCGM